MFVTGRGRSLPGREVTPIKAINQKIFLALCIAAWTEVIHVFIHDLLPLLVHLLTPLH